MSAIRRSSDDELELLEMQMTATNRRLIGTGRFVPPNLVVFEDDKDYERSRYLHHHARQLPLMFSTHPRRHRKSQSVMTLWSERHLLDEMQTAQLDKILRNLCRWDFNAFTFDRLSNGRNLTTFCTTLFQKYGILHRFGLDPVTVWKFFAMVERGYHATNPYHNSVHAADVTQAMTCFLEESVLKNHMTPTENVAALIAAVCHDVDHPGFNEKFLIASSSHLAGLYNNCSVLENHHWRTAISLMWESGFAGMLNAEDLAEIETILRDLILATDISRQQEFLTHLRHYQDAGELDTSKKFYRHFVLQIAIKCADISNPCRLWNVSKLWSYRACEEFYRQGDREKELELPVTPFCDRNNISVAKVQSGFYRFVASPLFEEWNRFMASPLSKKMLHNLAVNQGRWDAIVQQETRTAMADSVASQSSTSSSSTGGGSHLGDSRRESLDPSSPWTRHHRLSPRSSADEDSDTCSSYPYTPLRDDVHTTSPCSVSSARRHSLPVADSLSRIFVSLTSPSQQMTSPGFRQQHGAARHLASRSGDRRCSLRLKPFPPGVVMAGARRRMLAFNRTAISAVESTSFDCGDESVVNLPEVESEDSDPRTPEQPVFSPAVQFIEDEEKDQKLSRNNKSRDGNSLKNDFDPDLENCNRLVERMQLHLSGQVVSPHCKNKENRRPSLCNGVFSPPNNTETRRGSAPCNFLYPVGSSANGRIPKSSSSSRESSPKAKEKTTTKAGAHSMFPDKINQNVSGSEISCDGVVRNSNNNLPVEWCSPTSSRFYHRRGSAPVCQKNIRADTRSCSCQRAISTKQDDYSESSLGGCQTVGILRELDKTVCFRVNALKKAALLQVSPLHGQAAGTSCGLSGELAMNVNNITRRGSLPTDFRLHDPPSFGVI